jgi:hypothetical protein
MFPSRFLAYNRRLQAVQKVGLLDGFDIHLALYPAGAFFGEALLPERLGQLQHIGINNQGPQLGLTGIEPVDESSRR